MEIQFPLKMWPHVGPAIPMSEWAARRELGGLFFKKRKCRGLEVYLGRVRGRSKNTLPDV